MNYICEIPQYQHFAIVFAIALLEFWLGRTNKTKSGSIIEIFVNIAVSIVKLFFKKGESK